MDSIGCSDNWLRPIFVASNILTLVSDLQTIGTLNSILVGSRRPRLSASKRPSFTKPPPLGLWGASTRQPSIHPFGRASEESEKSHRNQTTPSNLNGTVEIKRHRRTWLFLSFVVNYLFPTCLSAQCQKPDIFWLAAKWPRFEMSDRQVCRTTLSIVSVAPCPTPGIAFE